MKRLVLSLSVVLGLLWLFSQPAYAHHVYAYSVPSQNYQYCYYNNHAYWQPPQLICYPSPSSPPIYLTEPTPFHHYYYQIQPPVVHYHIEVPLLETRYNFQRSDPKGEQPPAPIVPPTTETPKRESENKTPNEKQESKTCLLTGLLWLKAGESVSENVFVPDDPQKRHGEHLKRFGRYNWSGRHFEELPPTELRYFGKEALTFTAPETGCYARKQSGQWTKVNLKINSR